MKYRILIQKFVNANQAVLNWYMETGNARWETEDEADALAKYRELLEKYSAGDLTIVSPLNVDISVSV